MNKIKSKLICFHSALQENWKNTCQRDYPTMHEKMIGTLHIHTNPFANKINLSQVLENCTNLENFENQTKLQKL
jgi:hypothetical protein